MRSIRDRLRDTLEAGQTSVGAWRTRLVFIAAGFAALNWIFGRIYGGFDQAYHALGSHPASELIGVGAYLLMMFRGPTVGLLAIACASSAWLLFVDGAQIPGIRHPAERGLLIALPLYALLTHAAYAWRERGAEADPAWRRRLENDVDVSFIAFLRVATLVVTGFLALHKLNRDFFDPALTCHNFVLERLAQWGPAGAFAERVSSPGFAVASEALMAVLLVVRPRLGILHVALLMTTLWLAAFGRIAVLVVALALSFLEADDLETLRARRSAVLKIGAAILAAWCAAVLALPYQGDLMFVEILLYGVFFAAVVGGVAVLIASDSRAHGVRFGRGPLRIQWPRDRANRWLVTAASSAVLFSCLTPYLGLGFEYSFAMYSNLRADPYRWNSYVFPEAMQLFEHDYIEVTHSALYRGSLTADPSNPSGPGIWREVPLVANEAMQGMVFEPGGLMQRVADIRDTSDLDVRQELTLQYRGETFQFRNALRSRRFSEFLHQLPYPSMWWRPELSGRSPQHCVH